MFNGIPGRKVHGGAGKGCWNEFDAILWIFHTLRYVVRIGPGRDDIMEGDFVAVPTVIFGLVESRRAGRFCAPPMPNDAQILRAIGILGHAINQEPAPNILGFRDVLAWFIHSEIPAHRILGDRRIG